MKPLWEQSWFINTITFCRKWKWFDTYIYGKSANMEDFVRNPAEVLRDNCFPFVFKDVKNPTSVVLLRLGYIPYDPLRMNEYLKAISDYIGKPVPPEALGTYHYVEVGDNGLGFSAINGKSYELLFWNPWCTKYPNARFMVQVALSFKYCIPIPYVSLEFRYSPTKYFQFGLGWGPQRRGYLDGVDLGIWDASLSAKFRFASYLDELIWNPGAEVFDCWEGTS